jgi:predicted dinucleotide-utilizing enzyme
VDYLVERIVNLSREDAMEAALALQSKFGTAAADTDYVAEVRESPNAHLAEVDDLARLVLLVGASDPELRESVEEAVEAVGRRAFIFGGAEIVALAAIGAFVFTSVQSKGKATEKKKTTVKPDGTVITDEETVWVAGSGVIQKLLGSVIRHGSGG